MADQDAKHDAAGKAVALDPANWTGELLDVVATAQRVPRERVNIDTTFEELGMDSLDGINLIFAVEEKFDISIPDDAAKSIRTVREMVDGVAKLVSEKKV